MVASSEGFHESLDILSSTTQDMHRAIVSLREEIEPASMILEWLRRNHPDFAKQLRAYLFTTQTIVDIEVEDSGEEAQTEAIRRDWSRFDGGLCTPRRCALPSVSE